MAHTVVAAFQDVERAKEAVRQLEAKGFNDREVSLIGPDDKRGGGGMHQDSATDGAAWGAGIGGAAGLLAAVGAVAIPGIGPLIAAGPLAAALTGATAGGLTGAFLDLGIPAASSRRYEDELKKGHAVVAIQSDSERLQSARNVLQAQGAHDIEVD
ncbi:MAG: hypothetical protein M0Z66_01300 [Thermaerobacter sp.]|nr:hypothetical protein [Thermaerobacter sp.]